MSDDLLAAAFHHHRNRAVSVHLGSALLLGILLPSTSAVSLVRRASSADAAALSSPNRVNDRG